MRIASFDIGKKNFAFLIEEFKQTTFEKPKKEYNTNGTPTEELNTILTEIYKNAQVIIYKNSDITENCDKNLSLDIQTFYNLNNLLMMYKSEFDLCDTILIERQMFFGKQTNPMAVKLAQHTLSWFSIMYHNNPKILVDYNASNKTCILGCEMIETLKKGKKSYKTIDKPARKKWSVKKAIEILSIRKDDKMSRELLLIKKKDDISDTLLQLQAYKYQLFTK